MAAKISETEERKRELLNRSEIHRQAMTLEFAEIKTATAWVPKSVKIARSIYPVVLLVAPLLGYTFARKRVRPLPPRSAGSRGLFASALAGYKLFRSVKPLWDGLRQWKRHDHHGESMNGE